MEITEGTDLKTNEGNFTMIYGGFNVGKSTSCMESMSKPLLVADCEHRNQNLCFKALENKGVNIRQDITFFRTKNYFELIDILFLQILETAKNGWFEFNGKKYKALLIDSLSHYLNVEIITKMEDQSKLAQIFKIRRDLIDSFRVDESAYGSLASIGNRICDVLKKISQCGIFVVTIAGLAENPKWDASLRFAPNFAGKKFNNDYGANYDYIGIVYRRFDDNGQLLVPPNISFMSPDNDFICKWSGKPLRSGTGIFDFRKIFPEMYREHFPKGDK